MRLVVVCLGLALLTVSSCGKSGGQESKSATRDAIEAHLKKRPNMMLQNMTIEVGDVKVSGDKADAEVKFRSKQSPDLAVAVRYTLRRADDHWEVESSSPVGGMGMSPHGGAAGPMPAPGAQEPVPQSSH